MQPKVSVIVTTYNQEPYIEEALDSVLAQTYRPFEIIVVDDGSNDGTAKRIRPYLESIQYLYQSNQGVAASRNTGVHRASGELVAFLDGDDRWEPEKLAVQVRTHEEHAASGILVTDGVYFDETGERAPSLFHNVEIAFGGSKPTFTAQCYTELIRRNLINSVSQVMIPAAVLREVGPSDVKFKVSSDYDLYLRIAARYPITFIRRRLVHYRYVSSSASGPEHLRYYRWALDVILILKKQLSQGQERYRQETRRRISREVFEVAEAAYYYGRAGNWLWAACYLFRLMMHNPTSPAVAFFIVGLSLPDPIARTLGRGAHRALQVRHSVSSPVPPA